MLLKKSALWLIMAINKSKRTSMLLPNSGNKAKPGVKMVLEPEPVG